MPVVITTIVALAGCSTQPAFDQVYQRISPATLQGNSPIPLPQSKPLLTVTGAVGKTNQADKVVMDLSTIESIGVVEYTVTDPFEKAKRTFRGVLMKDLLAVLQVKPDATTLEVTALNDYKVSVPIQLVQDYPVLFALQQDGKYMKEDYRGPAMLVFPYDDYKFDPNQTDSYWVWQIKSLAVQ